MLIGSPSSWSQTEFHCILEVNKNKIQLNYLYAANNKYVQIRLQVKSVGLRPSTIFYQALNPKMNNYVQ